MLSLNAVYKYVIIIYSWMDPRKKKEEAVFSPVKEDTCGCQH